MPQRNSRHTPAAPVFPLARNSTVDLIAMELRNAIYSGGLEVGRSVREAEISKQLGVSRGPFREASQRLVQEGLLVSIPGRGLKVVKFNKTDIRDVYVARLTVEAHALRVLAAEVSPDKLAQVRTSFNEFANISKGEDAWAIGDADLAFHQVMVDVAGSPRLSRMMSTLVIETRICSLSVEGGFTVRRDVSPTYETILEALDNKDSETAIAALQEQFEDAVMRLTGADQAMPPTETIETTDMQEHEFQPIDTPLP